MSYLFLDVDGVLNPMATNAEAKRLDPTFTARLIAPYEVWVSEYQAKWLQDLLAQGVTIVWATTWVESEAMLAELAGFYGLPTDMPRIYGLDFTDVGNCGKMDGVQEWLTENGVNPRNEPCVWVDDMLGNNDRLWAWSRNIFPVTTDDRVGIADHRIIAAIEAGLGLTTRFEELVSES